MRLFWFMNIIGIVRLCAIYMEDYVNVCILSVRLTLRFEK